MANKPLPYLDRIDELDKVNVVRLKGNIDQRIIPIIDGRIRENRKKGSTIDRNVIIDYAKVKDVDTAAIAFHLVRLKEYEEKGFKVGFINTSEKLDALLAMFKQSATFKVYSSEKEALAELNK